jgi:hypothetical protein
LFSVHLGSVLIKELCKLQCSSHLSTSEDIDSINIRNSGAQSRQTYGNQKVQTYDRSRIQDEGEPGVEGVAVNLYNSRSNEKVATTTTDEFSFLGDLSLHSEIWRRLYGSNATIDIHTASWNIYLNISCILFLRARYFAKRTY